MLHRSDPDGLLVITRASARSADPILTMENVIVTTHAICSTDECFPANGRSACASTLEGADGRAPPYVVNREVLDSPALRAKLRRYAARSEAP